MIDLSDSRKKSIVTRADALWKTYLERKVDFKRLSRQTSCETEANVAHADMNHALTIFAAYVTALMDVGYVLLVRRNEVIRIDPLPSEQMKDFCQVRANIEGVADNLAEAIISEGKIG